MILASSRESGESIGELPQRNSLILSGVTVGSIPTAGANWGIELSHLEVQQFVHEYHRAASLVVNHAAEHTMNEDADPINPPTRNLFSCACSA